MVIIVMFQPFAISPTARRLPMKRFRRAGNQLLWFLKDSKGQTLIEYGLLLVLIAVVVIGAVTIVGHKTNNTFSTIGSSLP